MKKKYNWLIAVLALLLLLPGCRRTSSSTSLKTGDTRFLIVTLEGTDAASARVEAVKMETDSNGNFYDGQITPLQPGDGNRHCAVLDSGGEYLVAVILADGSTITHLAVLDESQVLSMNICVDPKAQTEYRTLWPATPHNSPDA